MQHSRTNLRLALDWLRTIAVRRLEQHHDQAEVVDIPILELLPDEGVLARLVERHAPTYEDLLVLVLALAPHVDPQFLDSVVAEACPEGGELAILGGARGVNHRGVLPTAETALFLLGGGDLNERMDAMRLFGNAHWFAKQQVLWVDRVPEGEPMWSGRLIVHPEIVEEITTGGVSRPRFSTAFPAEHLTTEMDWEDLVLHPTTLAQIRDIQNWVSHADTVMGEWGLGRRVRPGYRALFYGPPGTGKTITATLLGKHTGRDVFRIDLSRVISKYIGETEQNLARLFDRAESKDWILFFDEADALFGKRTDIRDAHDKYANQQASYLLQRIETFDGLVILATNQRNNIDDAFIRRFQSVIHFPMPRAEERLMLWANSLPSQIALFPDVSLTDLSTRYEISGAAILNVVQHCSIGVLADASATLDRQRLEAAIHREFVKEGKVV